MTYTIHDLTSIVDIPTAKLVEIKGATAVYRLANKQIVTLTILPTLAQWGKGEREKIPITNIIAGAWLTKEGLK